MTLLIDVGNSAVKWARLAADGSMSVGGRALHRGGLDVAAALSEAWSAAPTPRRAVGCSVANAAVVAAVERAARAAGVAEVEWMRSQAVFRAEVALVTPLRRSAFTNVRILMTVPFTFTIGWRQGLTLVS